MVPVYLRTGNLSRLHTPYAKKSRTSLAGEFCSLIHRALECIMQAGMCAFHIRRNCQSSRSGMRRRHLRLHPIHCGWGQTRQALSGLRHPVPECPPALVQKPLLHQGLFDQYGAQSASAGKCSLHPPPTAKGYKQGIPGNSSERKQRKFQLRRIFFPGIAQRADITQGHPSRENMIFVGTNRNGLIRRNLRTHLNYTLVNVHKHKRYNCMRCNSMSIPDNIFPLQAAFWLYPYNSRYHMRRNTGKWNDPVSSLSCTVIIFFYVLCQQLSAYKRSQIFPVLFVTLVYIMSN